MRTGLKHEKLVTFFLIVPITLGTVLIAQGMRTFYGNKGWFNQFLMMLGVISEPLKLIPRNPGVILSLFIQGFPFAFLMLLGYTSGINPDLEKASMVLGASKWQTFWRIMFPLMAPGIAIAFCLNFVMSFSLFPSAVMLGQPAGETRVIAYAAWQWTYEKFDKNMGSAICVIMAVIEVAIISIVLTWRQRMYKGASIVGKG
jgi:putative spermidine/putrescine transport system permease protein